MVCGAADQLPAARRLGRPGASFVPPLGDHDVNPAGVYLAPVEDDLGRHDPHELVERHELEHALDPASRLDRHVVVKLHAELAGRRAKSGVERRDRPLIRVLDQPHLRQAIAGRPAAKYVGAPVGRAVVDGDQLEVAVSRVLSQPLEHLIEQVRSIMDRHQQGDPRPGRHLERVV